MAKTLTVRGIEALKASDVRQEIPDGGLPGLYLIIQPSGVTSWAIRYRFEGKPKKFTIGPCPFFHWRKPAKRHQSFCATSRRERTPRQPKRPRRPFSSIS
ncbi:Arm DNA-binding domain-containing protein [Rhizobium beringeri]